MKILQTVQKHYAKCGLKPPNFFQKRPFNSRNALISLILGQCSISSFAFLLIQAETFSEYAESFYIASTMFTAGLNFTIIVSKSEKLFKLIEDIEIVIQKRIENERSKSIYEKVNAQVEKWAETTNFALVNVTLPCILIPNFIMSARLYYMTEAGSVVFKLPFPFWMPFAYTNPFEYLIAFTVQCVGTFILCQTAACTTNIFVGISSLLIVCAIDIKDEICIGSTEEASIVKQKLSEFVEQHANIKQLVNDFMGVIEFKVLLFFLCSVATICSSLLVIQIELQRTANPLILLHQICLAFWSFVLIFFFCYFGENISGQFNELNVAIYQCDWYNCSVKVQRLIPTILIATQHPPVLKGFGNVVCTREAFKKVANSGFSYFMMLRGFGQ